VVWFRKPCRLVCGYQRFEGIYYLHLQQAIWIRRTCVTP